MAKRKYPTSSQPIQICIALTGEVQEQGFQSMELITVELLLALGLSLILSSASNRSRARLIWEEQSDVQLQSLGLN